MKLARLAGLSFLQGMPQWALVRLAEAAAEQQLPAGGMMLRQSDRARQMAVRASRSRRRAYRFW